MGTFVIIFLFYAIMFFLIAFLFLKLHNRFGTSGADPGTQADGGAVSQGSDVFAQEVEQNGRYTSPCLTCEEKIDPILCGGCPKPRMMQGNFNTVASAGYGNGEAGTGMC